MNSVDIYSRPVIGCLPAGPLNLISDVQGVTVGHMTLDKGDVQTGVTVIKPAGADLFTQKIPAGVSIINGFGKSMGLIQLAELGVIETPIALTNTFSVPIIAQAQIKQSIQINPEIGRQWPTANSLVLECNDGYLNDLHAFAINESHYFSAYDQCNVQFEQGAVGAGQGMSSFQLKGGIGSASRIVEIQDKQYTVGALVLSNFGKLKYLQVQGYYLGNYINQKLSNKLSQPDINDNKDKGSIIMIIATDAPLDGRQLKRLSMRAAAGLARTGSNYGHGSGDISIAFSTKNRIAENINIKTEQSEAILLDSQIDTLFDAAAETVEQSIINALWSAKTTYGRNGHIRYAIKDFIPNGLNAEYFK